MHCLHRVWIAFCLAALSWLPGGVEAAPPAADDGAVLLMYHRFGEDALPSTSVSLDQFEAHLAELISGRYRVMALPDIVARLDTGEALPDRTVAITIDDAAISVYSEAWPRLKAARLPFTLFVSTEPLDLGLPDSMGWEQLRELAADPLVTIGHHGHRHAHMAWLTPAEQRGDIARASARFRAELGASPTLFAYPYGEMSLALRRAVQDAGFVAAFGQHSGVAGRLTDRFALPRFPLNVAYGAMDRFRLVANALPLPVDGVTPADVALAEPAANPPSIGFTLAEPLANLEALQCFASVGEPQLLRLDQRIELRFAAALPAGRARINCTLPADGGRWRWFGLQFVVR